MPLSRSFELFDSYLLEASAGTGKTFTIAHLFIRFLLEKVPLEKILVVTFTRAASAELKERIRGQIIQVIEWLEKGEGELDYLEAFRDDNEAILLLKRALSLFDSAAIMTIHAFCGRMLRQAGIIIEALEPTVQVLQDKKLLSLVHDILFSGLQKKGILSSQLLRLDKRVDRIEGLSLRYLRERSLIESAFKPMDEKAFLGALRALVKTIAPEELRERYLKVAEFYNKLFDRKGELHAPYEKALSALQEGGSFDLLMEGLEAFLHLSEDNLNRRKKNAPPRDELIEEIRRLVQDTVKGSDEKAVLEAILASIQAVKRGAKHYFQSHDDSLEMMHSALNIPLFLKEVKEAFSVVMVDEFQDTDPLQWSIFSRCFLKEKPLFLVGDPKQSIYSFRKADVYTYLEAAEAVGNKIILNTNWRSTPDLVEGFNQLFSLKPWLFLPKDKRFLEAPALAAGRSEKGFEDGRGAIHFFLLKKGFLKREQERLFLEAIVEDLVGQSSVAILVNDRSQAKRVEQFLKMRGLSVANWQRLSKDDDEGDLAFRLLLEALLRPEEGSRMALLLPLFGWTVEETLSGSFERARETFIQMKEIWNEKGFAACMMALLKAEALTRPTALFGSLAEQLDQDLEGKKILLEIKHQTEELAVLPWMRHPRLPDQLLEQFETHTGESRKMDEGINILTTFASKGLEFETVYALGLAFSSGVKEELFSLKNVLKVVDPQDEDYQLYKQEKEAERLRQLYVAMTRAKKRLYLPTVLESEENPLALFLEKQTNDLLPWLEELKSRSSISFSFVPEKGARKDFEKVQKESLLETVSPLPFMKRERLLSFTALAKGRERDYVEPVVGDMPSGALVGEIIHKIFEELPWGSFGREFLVDFTKAYTKNSPLEGFEERLSSMIFKALHTPLGAVKLADLPADRVRREIEFLHKKEGLYLKGFVDLAFEHEGDFFLVDWKSNRLQSYDQEALAEAMASEDYYLQAKIYSEAFEAFLKGRGRLKGIFYLFLRGLDEGGVYYVEHS